MWEIVVSFEMDQTGITLIQEKAVRILKTIFQYFYYLVFRMHSFVWYVIFYIE